MQVCLKAQDMLSKKHFGANSSYVEHDRN